MTFDESRGQRLSIKTYPPPKNPQPRTVTRGGLRQWILEGQKSGKDLVLADLRREHHEVIETSSSRPSINLVVVRHPTYSGAKKSKARSTSRHREYTRPFQASTSRKRGNCVVGWFDDFVREKGDWEIKSYTLIEALLGWATAGKNSTELMEEYDEEVWHGDDSSHRSAV
ncbi:hypothetical protein J3459_008610 [Metarhizium acridum]|uniref:uncharacterized protein n=1 Tax=Metarhizium acridum TaxID=92637 RepID=UPI001C6BA2D7|nr:hypothetical protein J3458_017755 [Metarhizium acridum]KAG8425917.1 hypothetical protein J3459_008610 [Metarhizium acridum]